MMLTINSIGKKFTKIGWPKYRYFRLKMIRLAEENKNSSLGNNNNNSIKLFGLNQDGKEEWWPFMSNWVPLERYKSHSKDGGSTIPKILASEIMNFSFSESDIKEIFSKTEKYFLKDQKIINGGI